MFRFFLQTILISISFTLSLFGNGQTRDTTDWSSLLNHSNFTEINSAKKIDKRILAKFPSWRKIAKRGEQFNATDVGNGRRQRLFFIAKKDNYWIVSYEHGGRAYHTHCFLVTIDPENNLSIQESVVKCESLGYLKAITKTENNLFRQWQGYLY